MVKFMFDVQELVRNNRIAQNDITNIHCWLEGENSVPKLNDNQISLFLIACDNNLTAVKKCIMEYYSIRKRTPEVFDNRNVTRDEIQKQLESVQFAIIPKRTTDNHVILINRLSNSNPSLYHMDIAMKLIFMCYDSLLYENPPDGAVLIFDMMSTTIRHITRTKINTLKNCIHYVQEGMPLKLKGIHVLNSLWFLDKFLMVIKPFFNSEVSKKLYFHEANKIDEFYDNFIPKSHFPSDYGGELPSVAELHNQTIQKLSLLTDYFMEEENQRKKIYN